MHRTLTAPATLAIGLLLAGTAADAKSFRFSYRGDLNSFDPYALNETFTHSMQGNVYEPLIGRGKALELEPALAVRWENPEPALWRFHLRPNVKFQNGAPFTADDVVFSWERALAEGSDIASKVTSIKQARKVDDLTVEFVTAGPNPILPQEITTWYILDKEWAEANGATKPGSVARKVENYATRHANGTGPFRVRSYEPDVKTVLVPNPDWWGKVEHNLTEAVFTPIKSDPTRVSALLSGAVDMIYPVPLQDVARISAAGLKVLQGPELRTIFLGMDVERDQLLESNVTGKNPLKDVRVRKAMYQAIDIEAIRDKVMRGASTPSALMAAPGINGFDAALNTRWPYDPEAARKLLAEAGYPDGFEIGMDCPNDRYVNDEAICMAVVPMLARVGIKVRLNAQTKSIYFQKVLSRNTSFFLLGWQPSSYDAHSPLFNVMGTRAELRPGAQKGQGSYNPGGYSNARVDALQEQVRSETDPVKRNAMIREAFQIHKDEVGHIPLHQQALAWAVRPGISLVQRADDALALWWVRVEN
ncbi:MAG: ABC transporter substrate-binding protein [Alphaproteobacteria bacterium]|nr:ABC transporter substrate-binding protein [Alphaproteobacteria bacterium]